MSGVWDCPICKKGDARIFYRKESVLRKKIARHYRVVHRHKVSVDRALEAGAEILADAQARKLAAIRLSSELEESGI